METILILVTVVAYLAGFVKFVKPLAESSLDNIIDQYRIGLQAKSDLYPHTFKAEHPNGMPVSIKPTKAGRARAVRYGVGRAIFWPVTMPMLWLSQTITTTAERELAARKELERYKALAKAEGLDWPGTE